jgi:hypothetical protein
MYDRVQRVIKLYPSSLLRHISLRLIWKRINLPLPVENQILNGDFWKYRERTVIAVQQTQTGTGKLTIPNLLLLYSFGFYWKSPNVLLRNRILPSFLHNNQPAASNLPLSAATLITPLQTPVAQLACAYHEITDNLQGTIILRCFDWLVITFIIITWQRLLSQCVSRILCHDIRVSTLMLATSSMSTWLTQVLLMFCSCQYKATWLCSSNLHSPSTFLLTLLLARF